MNYDHIVVGRGIAGIVLSEVLKLQGHSVIISDIPKENSASTVAAGSMNPIAMKRIIMSWRAAAMMKSSTEFYKQLETEYKTDLITNIPAERVHASEDESALWRKRELEDPVGRHITSGSANNKISLPHGSGRIPACQWLNVQELIAQHARVWGNNIVETPWQELTKARPKALVIHCTGSFDELPGLIPVQGELLTLHIPDLDLSHSVHRSGFLIPIGNDHYRLGATFEWKEVWAGTTEKGKEQLLEKLRIMIAQPFEIIEHWAGTRPTTKDRRPILGMHPKNRDHFVLNGLGSKGAMLAPWCAMHLHEHIHLGTAIDAEVDIARFL